MVQETVLNALYSLLRCAMGVQDAQRTEQDCIPLQAADWAVLFSLARVQAVAGLVYQGLSALSNAVPIPWETVRAVAQESYVIERRSARVHAQADSLLRELAREGLPVILMKGPAVAAYYPQPLLRVSGDIDLFFPDGRFQAALAFFRSQGASIHTSPDGSCQVMGDLADMDLHRCYFDLHVPEKNLPPIPSPHAELLLLSSHILKHAMGPGVGLRQICDMAVTYRALSGKYDPSELRRCFDRCGIGRWNRLLDAYLQARLGVDSGLYTTPSASWKVLETIILRGGNFGHYAPTRRKALERTSGRRKLDTLKRMLSQLVFGLKYAPREYVCYISELIKGNI